MSLGISEILLILVVVLVLFGGKKLPELARGIGRFEAEYKKAKKTVENEVEELKNEVKQIAQEDENKKA